MKYFYGEDFYIKGRCCEGVDYSLWNVIESDCDCKNVYVGNDGQPVWQVVDGKVINNPLPKSEEQMKLELKQNTINKITEVIYEAVLHDDDIVKALKDFIREEP